MQVWDYDPMIPFKPVVEKKHKGAFLTEDPIDIIRAGKVAPVPWIIGINTEDGAIRAAGNSLAFYTMPLKYVFSIKGIFGDPHFIGELDKQFNRLVPISLEYDKTSNQIDYVTEEIRKFYFGNETITNRSAAKVVDVSSCIHNVFKYTFSLNYRCILMDGSCKAQMIRSDCI